ncbi:VacJ family lipoprotein [Novosphingobium sp. G106]|nr:VacJ family lipoprotein [Novosphingobium sp. G106]
MVGAPEIPNASAPKLPEAPAIGRQVAMLGSPAVPDTDGGQDAIVVEAERQTPAGDPLEHVNETSFAATQAVDQALVGPVAIGYKHIIPEPVRNGLRNILNNLHEPVVMLNFLVQMKPGKASETLGRFAINSTIGAAGVFDMAKRRTFNLPRRPNGFADSLGYYGVKPGPYLFLPLVGPTTLRDLLGGAADRLVLPLAVGKPFSQPAYTVPSGIVGALNRRVEIDENLHQLREQTSDPYAVLRKTYLQNRQAEIDHLHSHARGEN